MPTKTKQEAAVDAAETNGAIDMLTKLLKDGGAEAAKKAWTAIDVPIERHGKKIVLPDDPTAMSYPVAIETIQRVMKEEAQVFNVNEMITGLPWDAAVAIYKAMKEIYGVVTSSTMMTFFGPRNPTYLTVHTGHRKTDVVQVPIGQLQFPGSDAKFELGIGAGYAALFGSVNKADRARLIEIASRARELLATESIYKGKAIRINVLDSGGIDMSNQPAFLDVTGIKKSDMIHPEKIAELINVNIFGPLEHTSACRELKIPLKRGILLEGPYGTGKSLTALVTAKVATDNDWGFIMLPNARGLKSALEYSKSIQPVVIFTEDIDRHADRARDEVNEMINTIDGVDTKTNEIMVVLTTNHVELIDKALLRPGRFDAIISLELPDAITVEKLLRKYAGSLLDSTEDLKEAGDSLEGQTPASIREAVERAKIAMLQGEREKITGNDLAVQAYGMAKHLALLSEKKALMSDAEVFYEMWKNLLTNVPPVESSEEFRTAARKVSEIHDEIVG